MTETEKTRLLRVALMNAVKPSYDIHITCSECGKESTTNNGEWLIWCGDEDHAQAILEAAKAHLATLEQSVKEWPSMDKPVRVLQEKL